MKTCQSPASWPCCLFSVVKFGWLTSTPLHLAIAYRFYPWVKLTERSQEAPELATLR